MARKSRAAVIQERQEVLETLRTSPDGLKQQELRRAHLKRTGNRIAYATLGRRLDELVRSNLVVKTHEGRNPTYRPIPEKSSEPSPQESGGLVGAGSGAEATTARREFWRPITTFEPDSTPEIPLSPEGAAALSLVRRPRGQRTPVTYNSQFLDDYEPGRTWYLPAPLREHLHRLGTTAYADQPAGTYARDIMQRLVIDLSWGSSRLEGNKYSRIDTEELINAGREAKGASDIDRQMILNHKAAIEFLVENAQEIEFNRYTVLGLHALLAENLVETPEDEGRLRTRPVGVGTSVYTPTAIPQLIEERFDTILAKARSIPDPLEQSFFMMVHVPYLQPFLDVNKRTSRLAANISLVKSNLCPLSFVDVPEETYNEGILAVYENTDVSLLRDVFSWAYERSCAQFTVLRQAMGTPDPIRLNYRTQLRSIVSEVVTERIWPSDLELTKMAAVHGVEEADRPGFVAAARRDLRGLRPDILGRYRLLQSAYVAWTEAIGDAREADS